MSLARATPNRAVNAAWATVKSHPNRRLHPAAMNEFGLWSRHCLAVTAALSMSSTRDAAAS